MTKYEACDNMVRKKLEGCDFEHWTDSFSPSPCSIKNDTCLLLMAANHMLAIVSQHTKQIKSSLTLMMHTGKPRVTLTMLHQSIGSQRCVCSPVWA